MLVIEDLRDQAELWTDACAEAGLNAMTASTGVQRYRSACASPLAIIILDLTLPDIDGWEVCRRLKTDGRTKRVPSRRLTAQESASRSPEPTERGNNRREPSRTGPRQPSEMATLPYIRSFLKGA